MKVAKWLALSLGVIAAAAVLAVVCAVIVGYTAYKPANPGWLGVADKTLWDWLDLLVIPFVIAVVGTVGGYFFARSENRSAQTIADKRAQDEALQVYLDQMGQLLLDKELPLRESGNTEAKWLARARTLTILQRLDADHKRSVLQFLSEAYLIAADAPENWSANAPARNPPVISLEDANLDHADISGMRLGIVDLSKASLRHADLSGCRLGWIRVHETLRVSRLDDADLSYAKLHGASYLYVYMKGAKLEHADLAGAMLSGGNLTKADFTGANLANAALAGVNLTEAVITEQQLLACRSLTNATMPNGQKYEDWLKSREGEGG